MKERIMKVLNSAVDEVNAMLERPAEFAPDMKLIGSQGQYDSMALVSLIATVEDLLVDEFDKQVMLVNEKAFSKGNSPFYSIETLCNYILELLKEKN